MLSVKQVAEMFNVSEFTIYKWAKSGKLPSFTIGGLIRFEYDEIMAYIRKGDSNK